MTAFNLDNLIRDNIKTMQPYSSARDEYQTSQTAKIFLDANENPYENGLNRYPDPQQKTLRKLLAERRGILENQILLGNGSDEVLDLLFRAFCSPSKDNVITLPPTYGMYKVLAITNDINNIEVPLTNYFELNLPKILASITKNTKLIFICSPNNPTGNILDKITILQLLNEFKGLVVIDEAYIDFSSHESWVTSLSQFPNLIVTQTLSKACGMAGIRLGICYASKEVISILNKIKPPYNVNTLTQQKALERLTDTIKLKKEITLIIQEKENLIERLETIPWIEHVYPSQANFLLVKVDDATKRYEQLLDKGIVVRNRSSQLLCANTLRITIGTSIENKQLIKVFNQL